MRFAILVLSISHGPWRDLLKEGPEKTWLQESDPTLMPFYQGYSVSSGKKLNSSKFYFSYIYSRIFRNILLKALGSHLP
jgi:hypothetical protein